jgi:hypothetical protein
MAGRLESFQNRAAVINRGDGLDIRLDLLKCPALLSIPPPGSVT